jgi:hypothetical protein
VMSQVEAKAAQICSSCEPLTRYDKMERRICFAYSLASARGIKERQCVEVCGPRVARQLDCWYGEHWMSSYRKSCVTSSRANPGEGW